MDIPNAKSHRDVIKKGYLQKLTSRSFPYIPHPWKRKYCLLVKGYLYFYEREDSKGADKGSGVVNLEYYDQVQETRSKDSKKASNVFSITSLDKTFFDQGRHLFSADTAHDMNDWITLLKRSIEQIRINIRPTTSTSSTKLSAPSSRPVSGDAKTSKTLRVEDRKREENIVKGKKRKDNEHDFDKENEDDSQRCTETSLRNKRGDPLLRNNSEAVKSAERKLLGRKKSFENQTEEASQIDLGHKPKGKTSKVNCKSEFKYAPGDLEGMMFDSLGRQRKADRVTGSYNKGAGCDSMGSDSVESSGSNCESKKRKADDDASESIGSRQQLESVTKNRVKGPAGRRRPQSRRTQQMMMKNRASSLSALAHNGVSADSTEGEENSNSARSANTREMSDSSSLHFGRNSFTSDSYRDSASSMDSKDFSYCFDSDKNRKLSFLIEEEDLEKLGPEFKFDDSTCDIKGENGVHDNNNHRACDNECNSNPMLTDCFNCNVCSSCKTDLNCKCSKTDRDLKLENMTHVRSDIPESAQNCSICFKVLSSNENALLSNTGRNPISSKSFRIERQFPMLVETVRFDDIDDALFFKSSKTLSSELNPTIDSHEPSTTGKSRNSTKKKVTLDHNDFDHSSRMSALSRLRQTLTSFRRGRLKTEKYKVECYPDENKRVKSKASCTII